jgi:hypothetical protein
MKLMSGLQADVFAFCPMPHPAFLSSQIAVRISCFELFLRDSLRIDAVSGADQDTTTNDRIMVTNKVHHLIVNSQASLHASVSEKVERAKVPAQQCKEVCRIYEPSGGYR